MLSLMLTDIRDAATDASHRVPSIHPHQEGYHAVMVRRGGGPNRLLTEKDDSRGKLEAVAEAIRAIGGTATAMFADGTAPAEVRAVHLRCYPSHPCTTAPSTQSQYPSKQRSRGTGPFTMRLRNGLS